MVSNGFISLADSCRGAGFSPASVCLSIGTIFQKTDAARITKLDIEMLRRESWKPTYFGGQKVKGEGYEAQTTVPAWGLTVL